MILSILFLSGAIIVFAYFAWAIRYHFVSARMPLPMRIVSALATTALLTGIIAVPCNPFGSWQLGLAATGVLAALGLFHGALRATRGRGLTLAFDPVASAMIADTGPYRWVRHPFYLSYIIFWTALLVAAPVWPLAALSLALVVLYLNSAVVEERTILAPAQAGRYRKATRFAGFLWPRLALRRGRQ